MSDARSPSPATYSAGPYASTDAHDEAAAAWVLHALEPDDEVAFLLHLDDCAACRATVSSTSSVLAALGGAVAEHEPPPRLQERLRAARSESTV